MKKETEQPITYKRAFTIILIMCIVSSFAGLILLAEVLVYQEKYEQSKIACVELNKIVLDGLTACTEYCNISDDQFQGIFFEYGVNKIRDEMNQTSEREVENNE